ncbi:hypothetical protein AA313_de0200414 [Arthrobotrys entomopaga]|nr:hypothetical protein AA313_de0200414 [Arthrobotrys entomopaga]
MAENLKMETPPVASPEPSKAPPTTKTETYIVNGVDSTTTSLSNRIGLLSGFLLAAGAVFSIACMGWFAFLWWGTVENPTWHSIVINDWAVRAISFPSSAFRMAIAIQAGACLSMLAAIAVEKSFVPLPNLASISIMRATAPSTTDGILKFIYPLIRAPGARPLGVLSIAVLAILILLTSSILSFTSTILLSDMTIQPIPASNTSSIIQLDNFWQSVQEGASYTTGFAPSSFVDRQNLYWQSFPPSTFANFAEASEDPESIPGLIDTGPTIRAFLPFASSEDRSRISSYEGRAVVWDARVVCQAPRVSNLRLHTNGSYILAISGQVEPTISAAIIQDPEPKATNFFCALPYLALQDWTRPLICQLSNTDVTDYGFNPPINYGGGLKSQFGLPSRRKRIGGAYLVLNRTVLSVPDETAYLNETSGWVRIQRIPQNLAVSPGPNSPNGTILGTLCYTPLDAVDRNVTISRLQPVAESAFSTYRRYDQTDPRSLSNIGRYIFDDILPKLIPGTPRKTSEERGVFSLQSLNSSWAMPETNAISSDGPWDNPSSNVTYPGGLNFLINELFLKSSYPSDTYSYGNFTLLPDDYNFRTQQATFNTEPYAVIGKTWHADLYTAVKDHPQGNSALALQALLTAIASITYYDMAQKLERLDLINYNTFRNVSSPGGPYGTRRGGTYAVLQGGLFATYVSGQIPVGYVLVAVVLGVQLILVTVIFTLFIRETTFTRIGDPWQAVAQVATKDVAAMETILDIGKQVDTRRNAVEKELENLGQHGMRVGVEQQAGGSTRLNQRDEKV